MDNIFDKRFEFTRVKDKGTNIVSNTTYLRAMKCSCCKSIFGYTNLYLPNYSENLEICPTCYLKNTPEVL